MRWFIVLTVLVASVLAAVSLALQQEGPYVLDIVVRTRTADGADPLKGVDLVLSGPEGHTGPGSITGYRVKTGDDGRVRVRLNLPGTYSIKAEHPEYEPATMNAKVESDKFPATISWTLRRKGVVTQYKLVVNVHTDAGAPVGGAEVSVNGPDPDIAATPDRLGVPIKTAPTGDNGSTEFTLPMRGVYLIRVSHKNFGETRRTVEFTEPGQTKTEDFIFRPVSSGMQIEVTAIDQDGDPVAGANVQFGDTGSRSTTTDFRGRASILIRNTEREVPNILNQLIIDARDLKSKTDPIHLLVTHEGFEPGTAIVTPITGGFDRMYPVTVKLNRKVGSGIKVHVLVFEKGSRQPLMDAKVRMAPTEFKATQGFNGSTDGDGRAILTAPKPNTYQIVVSRSNYTTITDTVEVTNYEKHEFSYELASRFGTGGKMHRMLRLKVRGKDANGKSVPIKGAAVTLSTGQSGVTDDQGNFCTIHTEAPGESLLATVTPKSGSGFKSKSDSVIVKANGTLFDEYKIQDAALNEYLRQERIKMTKERPGCLTFGANMERIWEALGNSWGKDFTAPIAAEIERAFGPQAVDNIVMMLDRSAAMIDGDVIPKKGAVKINENNRVEVALLYGDDEGPDLQVHEKVELFGPSGKLITNNVANRTLKGAEYNRRYFDIVCHESGTYTVKSTVTGPNGLMWTDKASFVVQKGTAAANKPALGVFKLTNKVVGKIDGTGIGPYGKWTASCSEGSFTSSYETTTEYDNHATFTANWAIPPGQLRPGDVIELTMTCSGRSWGRDAGYVGLGIGWDFSGSLEVLQNDKPFCGKASDGKDYPSASGKFKFKVGTGGQIKIWAHRGGAWGGDTGGGLQTEYTYIYDAPATPTTKPGKPKTSMTASGGG